MNNKINEDKAFKFWNWFVENNQQFLELEESNQEKLLDDIIQQLHQVDPNLYLEIGEEEDGLYDLIITAEGDTEYFETVESLVNLAPEIEGWSILAFKPRMGFDMAIRYKDIELDSSDMWFLPLEHPTQFHLIGLRIGIPDFDESNESIYEDYYMATTLLLENCLGERSAALDIAYLELCQAPESPLEENFSHLNQVDDYILWKKSKMN